MGIFDIDGDHRTLDTNNVKCPVANKTIMQVYTEN